MSKTTSNATAQCAEIRLYRFVFADVLWRSARPSQVAISVSNAVMAKIATQMRAVATHQSAYRHVTQPLIQSAACSPVCPDWRWHSRMMGTVPALGRKYRLRCGS